MNIDEIKAEISEFLIGSNAFLVDVKLSKSKLSVYLDAPDGITLEECSRLNRHLFQALEGSGFNETHDIEVSSPGMDQPLKVYQQYLRRKGKNLRIVTAGGEVLHGKLTNADESGFYLIKTGNSVKKNEEQNTASPMRFNYNEIREAKATFSFN